MRVWNALAATKVSLIYKATGKLKAMQILLGHTNIKNTVRYLGVNIDDALKLSERTTFDLPLAPRCRQGTNGVRMNERQLSRKRSGNVNDGSVGGCGNYPGRPGLPFSIALSQCSM